MSNHIKLLGFILLLFFSTAGNSQYYRTAAGIRLGNDIGITVQQTISKYFTIEGLIHQRFQDSFTYISIMAEPHTNIITRRFNLYLGGGPSLRFNKNFTSANNLSLIAGLELSTKNICYSFDYKPLLLDIGGKFELVSQSAFSIRYIIVKAKKRKIHWNIFKKKK